ncbi:MAG TPA: cation-binding protein, partial [Lachnospiraceae bacterium]|nr:cation-binding protein [Lachnospiraceae bacterium]
MKYELTKDLETGNALIDSEHRELFRMVNNLQDACAKGQGRSQVETAAKFLVDYVKKHFRDEQNLQTSVNYPGYPAHKKFHE